MHVVPYSCLQSNTRADMYRRTVHVSTQNLQMTSILLHMVCSSLKNASLTRADVYFFCQCFENARDDKLSMKRMADTKIADVALVQICASSTSSWSRGLLATYYMYAIVSCCSPIITGDFG